MTNSLTVDADGRVPGRPDPADVATAVAEWLHDTGHPRARVLRCERLKGGMETWGYTLSVEGAEWPPEPVVLRLQRWPDSIHNVEAERAALESPTVKGLGAPRFLAAETSPDTSLRHPFLVETFVPGDTMGQTWFIPRRRRARDFPLLGQLQASLHARGIEGTSLPVLEIHAALDDLRGVEDKFGPSDEGALDWMVEYSWIVESTPADAVLHLDFHSGNVMRDGDDLRVIDWSQARLGDPMADLGRTLEVLGFSALIVGLPPLFRRVTAPTITDYARAYAEHGEVDATRLRYWRAYHALYVRAQLLEISERFAGTNAALERLARRGAYVMLWRWSQLTLRDEPPF